MLETQEREIYAEIWTGLERYQSPETSHPGLEMLPMVLEIMGDERGTLYEAGCGNGETGLAYQREGFQVTLGDITEAGLLPDARTLPFVEHCLWHPVPNRANLGGKFDLATCTDVLEHLPTQFTMLAVQHLLNASRRVFVSVFLNPDVMGYWVGRPLHLTVQPYLWWRDSLRELGTVVEARDLIARAAFLVEGR